MRSTRRQNCSDGQNYAVCRSLLVGPVGGVWSLRLATRRGFMASSRPCPRHKPGDCAQQQSSSTATTTTTGNSVSRLWTSWLDSRHWSSLCRSTRHFLMSHRLGACSVVVARLRPSYGPRFLTRLVCGVLLASLPASSSPNWRRSGRNLPQAVVALFLEPAFLWSPPDASSSSYTRYLRGLCGASALPPWPNLNDWGLPRWATSPLCPSTE